VISINLLAPKLASVADNGEHQVLRKIRVGAVSRGVAPAFLLPVKPPSLSPALMERLLGKSPLRLISARNLIEKGIWREMLECGHSVTTFQDFRWDEKSHLVLLDPSAKRRRCRECKAIAKPKPVRSVTLEEERKRRGGKAA
jgi:hypothetical protein